MPSFTIDLWQVLELREDPAALDPWVPGAGSKIGLDRYEIFDDSHRDILNQKICAEFYNREIGLETIDMFVFALERRMRKIMPYWNQVYKSELIQYDPLATYNLETIRNDKTTEDTARTASNVTASENDSRGTGLSTDTPQSQLPDDWEEDANYATSGSASKSTTTINANVTSNDTADTTSELDGSSTTKGFQGSAADLLARYRAVLLNVDSMVISQLSDLFMLIRANGDEILPSSRINNYYALGMGY
jgi:hypothetical protein